MLSSTLLAFFRPEAATKVSQRTLTFAERVAYQRAIEEVYWRHRIWPKERPDPKPSLDAVMSQAQLEKKVEDYLRDSRAPDDYWQKQIAPEQLQAEMERMAQHSKQPDVLRELFDALGNDPFVIAECLARPVLSERLLINRHAYAPRTHGEQTQRADADLRTRKAQGFLNTGWKYNPSTDSWIATSTTNAPTARVAHTALWTGGEMIVWGGLTFDNTGGRYNPATDTWTATSTSNAPDGRFYHTAVWTGSKMIVWGGTNNTSYFSTGGRYNASTDSWSATSTTNAPDGRWLHTAVWTSSEMIVWGGTTNQISYFNTGGRYNQSTDSWTATSTINAPGARASHTAVWTGSEMIVWGGFDGNNSLNTGGRYCAQSAATPTPTPTATPSSTPTPTPTATPTPSPTPTPAPTPTPCMGRCTPTPRPRPTPAPRP